MSDKGTWVYFCGTARLSVGTITKGLVVGDAEMTARRRERQCRAHPGGPLDLGDAYATRDHDPRRCGRELTLA